MATRLGFRKTSAWWVPSIRRLMHTFERLGDSYSENSSQARGIGYSIPVADGAEYFFHSSRNILCIPRVNVINRFQRVELGFRWRSLRMSKSYTSYKCYWSMSKLLEYSFRKTQLVVTDIEGETVGEWWLSSTWIRRVPSWWLLSLDLASEELMTFKLEDDWTIVR